MLRMQVRPGRSTASTVSTPKDCKGSESGEMSSMSNIETPRDRDQVVLLVQKYLLASTKKYKY